ncbi:MAG: hypothetical protein RR389_07590, partial [Christensenella sp.]
TDSFVEISDPTGLIFGDLAIAPNEIAVGQIRVSTDVTESEKRLIAQNLNGKTAAMYLDLTCAVVFYNADTGAFRVQQLTDMQQPMRLTVDIGEYAGKGENYCVLREHAGVVDELAATLNGTLLTFESSKFSTYSVAYTAFAQPTPAPTAAPSEPAPSEPAPTVAPSGSIPPARSAAKTKTTDAAASAEANLETAVSVPTVAAVVVPKESGKEHTSEKSDTEAAQAQKKTEENAQTTGAVRLMWQILICIALAVVIVAAVWVVKKHKKNSKKRKHVKK